MKVRDIIIILLLVIGAIGFLVRDELIGSDVQPVYVVGFILLLGVIGVILFSGMKVRDIIILIPFLGIIGVILI